ncbi:P-loop containing nucleoside triphosphate hydrolases superfamily protein isoform 1 [Hibiscus syriacus]|uniref:P-loop containing nucleoside triphosphate hydrolases superfamily protein isoform 1 n=1 Tax=Hibiscus syriacus TaxID=106335 RepID=A0A6A3C411_HIBSY|nr:P-loop containing nucleoside triphosphate hydrolases superfamily protein isoform 1 [Hibiscus syriacus]
MATKTIASKPARQLGELLREQQEPFALEVYLSEKGCGTKNLTSIHSHGSSGKFLKKSGSNKIKRNKGIPNFPKVLKVLLCNKFFTIRGLRTKNPNDEDGNNQEIAEADRFSSSSCSALYNSSSDSDTDEASMFTDNSRPSEHHAERGKKAAVDTKFQLSACMEDSKQNSPQSVLEAISTSTGSPLDTS